ncbi:YceI family protein [uncultured Dokdonia sp.]|uniref:YceI family protein n=1 Tax=uncultured Dokdonia sp. TaxID=575653 RepID=UPI002625F506|nr:YceI family protein [uncultured Dokdonia sp.]
MYAQQITINEDQATIHFTFVDKEVDGELSDFTFTGSIDLNALETSTIGGSVATETLDTNNWFRNRHLRSEKYFSTKAHPRLYFKSNTIKSTAMGFRVSGQLTIKGITQDVAWDFTKSEGNLIGVATINTHDYDIKVYDERERNQVTIKIVLPYTQ